MVKFIETPLGLVIEITSFDSVRLSDQDQRKLIVYLWRTKPEMVREIVCEECPEHVSCTKIEERV